MADEILLYDKGVCLGSIPSGAPQENDDQIMGLFKTTLPNGDVVHVIHIYGMDYGVVVPEKIAVEMYNVMSNS